MRERADGQLEVLTRVRRESKANKATKAELETFHDKALGVVEDI